MDFGKLLGDSFAYTKDGLFGKPVIWILLIVLALLPVIPIFLGVLVFVPSLVTGVLPDLSTVIAVLIVAIIVAILLAAFYAGYEVKILRGETPLPAVSGFGSLFSDGIRYIVIEFVYSIPVFIILGLTLGAAFMSALSAGSDMAALLPILGGVFAGIIIALIVGFIIGLFAVIGMVRFTRTGSMREGFNFGAIRTTIGRIGWGTYILALIIIVAVIVVVEIVLGIIPYIGGILQLIVSPFITVFSARYIALLYNSAEEAVTPQ